MQVTTVELTGAVDVALARLALITGTDVDGSRGIGERFVGMEIEATPEGAKITDEARRGRPEVIALLKLDDKSEGMLYKMLKRRENLGSTGIGRGIAIPHCRSLVVSKLRVAFGRKPHGVDFKAIDEKPVKFFFLIVAPPLEVSNQYLPVLGKIAQFSKEPDVPGRLLELTEPKQFLALLEEKGV